MPTAASRRIRYALLATCALGAIGAGYAGIASAQAPADNRDSSLAATTADTGAISPADTDATSPAAPAAETDAATPSATASPASSPSSRPSPSATRKPSAKPKRTTTKTKRPTPTATKTTRTSAPSGGQPASGRVAEVIRLVNVERKKAGCGSLTGESRLHAAAQKHSELQAEKNTMSHQLPGEPSMGDRVTAQGYRWGGVAENVAAGYTTPASVMDGWMNSPGHKANILNCGYKHIGVGVKKSAQGTLYWTQNFASPL